MDESEWDQLTTRFPRVPAEFRMEMASERSPAGEPIRDAHRRAVIALAFSPDSLTIAASGSGRIPGAAEIRVFDVATRELRRICHAHRLGVFDLAFDQRTGLLASASHDYSVILWDIEQRDSLFLLGGPDECVSRQAVSFLGTRVFIADGMTFAGENATLTTIDLTTGVRDTLLELEGDLGIAHLAIAPEQEVVAIAIEAMRSPGQVEIRILGRDGTERCRVLRERSIYALDLVGALLVATGADDQDETELFTIDVLTGQQIKTRRLGPEIGGSLAVDPKRQHVAVAYEGVVDLCRVDSLEPVSRLDLGAEQGCSVAWSPDGRWVAVGTLQRTLRLFDLNTGREHLS